MIIFLYGPDGYRLKENVDTIVGAYHKKYKNGMSYYRFDFTSPTCKGVDELASAIKSISFFDEAKLVIVKNIFYSGQTTVNRVIALIDDLKITTDKKTVLVFIENKTEKELQKNDKDLFAMLVSKNNLVRNLEYLSGVKLSNWVKNKFKESGHGISSVVVSQLVNIVGNESWALANEVEKLSNYKRGSTIIEKDINLLVGHKEVNNVFDLIDAVGSQNKVKAFEMMFRLTNSGLDDHYLLSMLVYHFENLLSVSDLLSRSQASGGGVPTVQSVAQKCSMHPFVARKAISQAQRFRKDDLLAKFNYLASLDISSKNGLLNLGDSLYNFVIS